MAQLTHTESVFTPKTFPLVLVCDRIEFQPNIGSIFRVCEAFGVQEIIFIGEGLALTPRKINRTSRSTHKMVPYRVIEQPEEAIQYLQKHNFQVIALEITGNSKPLREISVQKGQPVALIAGSEISGISDTLLAIANATAHIDMFGQNSSMNVVQATAIALYDITGRIS